MALAGPTALVPRRLAPLMVRPPDGGARQAGWKVLVISEGLGPPVPPLRRGAFLGDSLRLDQDNSSIA